MGNTHTKEERTSVHHGSSSAAAEAGSANLLGPGRHGEFLSSRRSSRAELSPLGVALVSASSSSSRQQDVPFERRETKQEREARKLEKERATRIRERERSIQEEHVDGGYLVTMGIYTASEDFNKPVVRQLQIERKIAPFWRGLDDFNNTWAEHQIIAAARGLEIPPADQVPENLIPEPRPVHQSPEASSPYLNTLMVPLGPRTLSALSDRGGSNPGSAISTTISPAPPKTTSPLKQPKKALAAALNLSRNSSQSEIVPQEINLPHDPFVNGQALEVFLYKEGEECPLCLMYYPPYLNRTRCCCQLICSECFVQIKRPDPHFPEHHGEMPNAETSQTRTDERDERLIMEPAKCPYCTQPDFGVTYENPPFQRGLAYALPSSNLGAMNTAMSSTSSLNSSLTPVAANHAKPTRNRAQSVSANAPGVITADRIRPDWAAKLATARAHQRRRAAAADALHHAAFVMGNQESRTIFGRSSRFARRQTGGYRGTESPGSGTNHPDTAEDMSSGHDSANRNGLHRGRIDAAQLENLMMAEAIRLSLADEEERRKKAEKEARKEAKKREKEERKSAKKKGEDVYSGRNASVSSLSLGLGRKRGNSSTGNLRVDAGVAAATVSAASVAVPAVAQGPAPESSTQDKGKGIERATVDESSTMTTGNPSAVSISASQPRALSHLRQVLDASSISSDGLDSVPGSYTGNGLGAEDSQGNALSLGGQSDQSDNANTEPLFNFRSLAEVVRVSIDGDVKKQPKMPEDRDAVHLEYIDHALEAPIESAETSNDRELKLKTGSLETHVQSAQGESPPNIVVVPDTPAYIDDDNKNAKHRGLIDTTERSHEVPQ
ncbi:hypothetical protein GGS21DRAFT_490443 [Xylaria nigripes]|nr:hypothetical protein GGS21DRAFT_490443 [Xylaria nigripes]